MKLAIAALKLASENLLSGAAFVCARAYAQARARVSAMQTLRTLRGVFVLCALLVTAPFAAADSIPSNDFTSLEITINPSVERGVLITTDTAGMLDLGNVEMNASTQTVHPATVTVIGTVTNTELDMSATITGGWKFDNDVSNQEEDNLQVWTVFKTTEASDVPSKSGSDFDDAQDALTPPSASAFFPLTRVGLAGGNTGLNDRFEDGNVGMDSLVPNTKRHWWFYFRTPTATTTVDPQRITFILTVTPGP